MENRQFTDGSISFVEHSYLGVPITHVVVNDGNEIVIRFSGMGIGKTRIFCERRPALKMVPGRFFFISIESCRLWR